MMVFVETKFLWLSNCMRVSIELFSTLRRFWMFGSFVVDIYFSVGCLKRMRIRKNASRRRALEPRTLRRLKKAQRLQGALIAHESPQQYGRILFLDK